jgi:selenoprotein W-related protein
LAEKLLNTYKNRLAEVALVPSQGGAFEVSVNGASTYSKLASGSFPDERKLVAEMESKL